MIVITTQNAMLLLLAVLLIFVVLMLLLLYDYYKNVYLAAFDTESRLDSLEERFSDLVSMIRNEVQ